MMDGNAKVGISMTDLGVRLYARLDLASPIKFDRSGCPQIAHQEHHPRSSHTEHLRQGLLVFRH
jgi:hypothetical protein